MHPMEKSMKNKILGYLKNGLIIICALVAGVFGKEIGKHAFSPSKPSQEEINKSLLDGMKKAADQLNAQGSIMVDEETRRDRVTAGPGPNITYFMSTPKITSSELISSKAIEGIKPSVINSVCTNEKVKPSLEYGGAYNYVYSGSDNVEVGRIRISINECK
jgi:hypothetical protein